MSKRILAANSASPGRVLVVDKYENGDYLTIQQAINYAQSKTPSASSRWVVYVMPGIYAETLTLYDYVNVIGLDNTYWPSVNPASGAAIDNIAECYIKNLTFYVKTGTAIQTGASGAGKTLRLVNCRCNETTEYNVLIKVESGTVIVDRCEFSYGGEIDLLAGTLKVWDSRLTSYHGNTAAPIEHCIDCVASSSLEVVRSTLENLSAGSAIRFRGAMTACKVLDSILRKASGATYTCVADSAVTLTIAGNSLNADLDTNITAPAGGNFMDAGI